MRINDDILETVALATLLKRRCGKTTALAKAAESIGATFVCAERSHADDVRHTVPGVKTVDMSIFYSDEFRVVTGPFIFDHYAIEKLLRDVSLEMATLRTENRRLDKIKAILGEC